MLAVPLPKDVVAPFNQILALEYGQRDYEFVVSHPGYYPKDIGGIKSPMWRVQTGAGTFQIMSKVYSNITIASCYLQTVQNHCGMISIGQIKYNYHMPSILPMFFELLYSYIRYLNYSTVFGNDGSSSGYMTRKILSEHDSGWTFVETGPNIRMCGNGINHTQCLFWKSILEHKPTINVDWHNDGIIPTSA